ncbi:hypothetical protein [Streptomyces showdoensis]|uniref:Type IV secretion protein Rhs n=1 Tax=Streptomyces showdoensis TaxID=68268 RepID=A0A2P2GFT3_STREW|nr:hypothetical protein [Streptomyces showdoensis]KKZ70378.1 hypothetical protein VO63_29105 [Streptomyces showdoensis]
MSFAIRYSLTLAEERPTGGPADLLGTVAEEAGPLAAFGGLTSLPLNVSNDVLGGSLVLDADITVTMGEGAVAGTFEAVLVNLPAETVRTLRAALARRPLSATVRLGYFDDRSIGRHPVMAGRVVRLASWVAEDGLSRVRLTGQDAGGYALRMTSASVHRAEAASALDFARKVVNAAGLTLAKDSALATELTDHTVRNPTALDALRELARTAEAPVVIRDRLVLVGPAVGADDPAPVAFDPEVNLVSYGDTQGEETLVVAPGEERPPVRNSVNLTVLGHPDLRVGQVATLRGIDDAPAGPLRVNRLVHRFGVRTGYVCEVQLVAARAGEFVEAVDGVRAVTDRLDAGAERALLARPSVDVGEVSGYRPDGHQVSLRYGQSPPPSMSLPSVTGPIGDDVLLDKPVAAPFAFGPCGLMTPVYPGMRALLAHNRNLVNDAAVVGWLWPRTPGARAPAPEPGDYWLALPTGTGSDGIPTGPGVNDLTDAKGGRVIQARGLHILVGTPKLPQVGTRPTPPDDDSVTIEHHTGTTIEIDPEGAVTVRTKGSGIKLTNGTVSLSLDGASVQVT